MRTISILIKEMFYRKLNSIFATLAVALAAGAFLTTMIVLDLHDQYTEKILSEKKEETETRMCVLNDEMRKASLKMGFNLLILPEDQNLRDWHSDDYASKYMPEEYVIKLADSGIVLVTHFLPSLRQKTEWPEIKRTVILIGTRGEVPNLHKNPRKPLVQPVPDGGIVLGHELHQSLGIKEGDHTEFMGQNFKVHKCHEERGNQDDMTVWITLHKAQEILNKKGLINSILALECICANQVGLEALRAEIKKILPNTQIIEVGSKVVARAEARLKVKKEAQILVEKEKENRDKIKQETENFASIALPVIMIVCVIWVAYLGFTNVKDREIELGILRSLGYRSSQIILLFLSKSFVIGLIGGALGHIAGSILGPFLGSILEGDSTIFSLRNITFYPSQLLSALAASTIISVMAGWLPAQIAAQKDPAQILQKEQE